MLVLALPTLGVTELILILVVILLIFGPKQIPKLAKMFGKASKKFKEGLNDEEEEEETKTSVKKEKAGDEEEA
ncbi:MAG: twin-arginine translocase TatA/TatE family subunit [Lachnospiraceae bacterium]|nr:twin-arginine translocase TatA/TatE family subunit [Lachnospiraceae bacterium]